MVETVSYHHKLLVNFYTTICDFYVIFFVNMSFFFKFVSKNRLEKSWIGKFGNFFQRSNLNIIVKMLDGSELHKDLPHHTIGSTLFNKVTFDIDLMEIDYFGLQFVDPYGIQHWLDPSKKIKPQLKRKNITGPPYVFSFRVKFYTHEPGNLHEEVTRYQFFLQLKQDVLEGRLKCSEEKSVELAALALQAELGDYEEDTHTAEVASEFRFVQDQSPQMEALVLEKLKTLKGLTPAQAERSYIDKLRWHDDYGVDMHEVEGKDNRKHFIGLSPAGIHFYHQQEPDMVIFFWNRITKLYFKKRMLSLVVLEYDDDGNQIDNLFAFRLASTKACKSLWKCAVEQHAFFQLKSGPSATTRKNNFFRRGSKFRYSGKTQFQTASLNVSRRNVSFERKPSQRFSRRDAKTDDASRTEFEKEIKAKILHIKNAGIANERHSYIEATNDENNEGEKDENIEKENEENVDETGDKDNNGKSGINVSDKSHQRAKVSLRPLGPPPQIPTMFSQEIRDRMSNLKPLKERLKTTEL